MSLASTELRPLPAADRGSEYEETEKGIVWNRVTTDGMQPVRLTNFTARIISDISEDDGVNSSRIYEIQASRKGAIAVCRVTPSKFVAMNWPIGASRCQRHREPWAGNQRSHACCDSGDLRRGPRAAGVHPHRLAPDRRHGVLRTGGAIGADGPVDGVEVDLLADLGRFSLPEPLSRQTLLDAMRGVLALLTVAPERVMYPLVSATYRTLIGPADFGMVLTGLTGTGKSEIAALIQQHSVLRWMHGICRRPGPAPATRLSHLHFTPRTRSLSSMTSRPPAPRPTWLGCTAPRSRCSGLRATAAGGNGCAPTCRWSIRGGRAA